MHRLCQKTASQDPPGQVPVRLFGENNEQSSDTTRFNIATHLLIYPVNAKKNAFHGIVKVFRMMGKASILQTRMRRYSRLL